MAYEGFIGKPEVARGLANVLAFWPRIDGALVTATSPAVIGMYDSAGSSLGVNPLPTAAVDPDGAIRFSWTPDAGLLLDEDLRFEIRWTDPDGRVREEPVYFDLVLSPLSCPIDDASLRAKEPLLDRYLASLSYADGRQFVMDGWSKVVARIRGEGFRPALITDRHAFVAPATWWALEALYFALMRAAGDLYDTKRLAAAKSGDVAFGAIGKLKFMAVDDRAAAGSASALPRFVL